MLVLLSIALGVLKAFFWSRGEWNPQVFGYAFSSVLIPFLIAYAIAGRKNSRKPVTFGLCFLGISFVFLLMEMAHPPKNPNDRVADLLREATGAKSSSGYGSFDSPTEKLTREVMGEFLAKAKTYQQQSSEMSAELEHLYSAPSFSSLDAMNRTRASVQKITELDHNFVLQCEQWPARVREQVARSSVSESDKQGFLKGFDETYSKSDSLTLRRKADQIEAQWSSDTLALYAFAASHASRLHVKDDHIFIAGDDVCAEFNELLRKSREQQQKLADVNTQLANLQSAGLQRYGLTKSDFGMDDTKTPTKQHAN